MCSPLPEIPQNENAAESWETLEEVCWDSLTILLVFLLLTSYRITFFFLQDLIQLSQLVTDFSVLVSVSMNSAFRIRSFQT